MKQMEGRIISNIRKYALLISVFVLAALIGSIWMGWNLTILILVFGALLSTFSINLAPKRILKMQGAVRLDRTYYSNLYHTVSQLASKAHLSKSPDLYMIRSKIPNAFAMGTKEKPLIGITQGLLAMLNDRELQGVLAHEISHIKNNDLFVKGLALSFGNLTNTLSTIGKFLLFLALPLYLLGVKSISLIAVLVLIFSPILNVILQLGLSRSMEYLADHDAATITRDPLGLASALQNIDSMSSPWWKSINPVSYQSSDWLSSHPNTEKRIEKLKAMSNQFAYHDSGEMYGAHIVDNFIKTRPYFWL